MKKIKIVLIAEINEGKINWDKLSAKIHVSLGVVGHKFELNNLDDKSKKPMKFADALTFKDSVGRAYKLISPRFMNGDLWCSGINYGFYSNKQPIFLSPPVMF
jgi:hypothetical protein